MLGELPASEVERLLQSELPKRPGGSSRSP